MPASKKDVLLHLKQDKQVYCSTMLDLYGLGEGFPGTPIPESLRTIEQVRRIEASVKEDICKQVPDLRAELRFVPYIQLHEYEGLLFSNPSAFASSPTSPTWLHPFRTSVMLFRHRKTSTMAPRRPLPSACKRCSDLLGKYCMERLLPGQSASMLSAGSALIFAVGWRSSRHCRTTSPAQGRYNFNKERRVWKFASLARLA